MTSALTYFEARLILPKQQLHLKAKRWKEKLLKSSFPVRGLCPARLRAARLCSLLFCQLLGFPDTSFPGTGCSLGSPSKGQGSSPCLSPHLLHSHQMGEVINSTCSATVIINLHCSLYQQSGLGSQHPLKCFHSPCILFLGESCISRTITFSLSSVCIPSVFQCFPEDLGLLGYFSKAPHHCAFHISWFASIPHPDDENTNWDNKPCGGSSRQ